jgi:hypothetical protein
VNLCGNLFDLETGSGSWRSGRGTHTSSVSPRKTTVGPFHRLACNKHVENFDYYNLCRSYATVFVGYLEGTRRNIRFLLISTVIFYVINKLIILISDKY